jgi:hypothetical protein
MTSDPSPHSPHFDAFLSHASRDSSLAAKLMQSLDDDGLTAWIDHADVRFGALLRNELQAGIRVNDPLWRAPWNRAADRASRSNGA